MQKINADENEYLAIALAYDLLHSNKEIHVKVTNGMISSTIIFTDFDEIETYFNVKLSKFKKPFPRKLIGGCDHLKT